MMKALTLVLSTALLVPAFAKADEDFRARTRCSARAIDRFYCPVGGGNWWQGPYWDDGCSVKCQAGQRAVCEEASCDDSQNGDAVPSSCVCE